MGIEISIIVPCRNEAENVLELAERAQATFEAHGLDAEIVFVNDASTDHTGALIDDLAARHAFVRGVHHPVNRGIPGGWESGVNAARGRYVIIMDGDLQNMPEDVYRLYRQLKHTNADIVQGWRSHIGRPRDFRYLMSRVLHHMLHVLFGTQLYDIKSGFLICDREIFAHILRHRFSYYYFQSFIVVSAHHKGYRIDQVETLFEERKLGESFISSFPLKMILKNLADLVTGFVEFRLLSTRTDVLSDFIAQHPPERPPEPLPLLRRWYLRLFATLMPLHHWKLSSTALRYYYQLRRTQWLAPEAIRSLQEARLRVLIKHAYRHVPYYREQFDRLGIDPTAVRGVDALQRLPVLTKQDLRKNLHFDLMSDVHDKRQMLPVTTTGASGEPITWYADKTQLEMRWAATLRNYEWMGYAFGDRFLQLRASSHGPTLWQALQERIDAWLSRRVSFPVGTLNRAVLDRLVGVVRQRRPALIDGDAEAVHLVASYLQQAPADGVRLRSLVTSEQTLSPESRERIAQAFQTQVFDRYSSCEFSAIAHECEAHEGYHVNAESYIVEIVRDGRPAQPGEVGDVLVTDLTNLSVPLIRYVIGDRAVATEARCRCGRGLPLLGPIQGRAQSVLIGTNGSLVPGTLVARLLRDHGYLVRQFRIVQSEPGTIDFHVVKGARYSEAAFNQILARVREHLGADVVVRVHAGDHLVASENEAPGSVRTLPISPALFADSRTPSSQS